MKSILKTPPHILALPAGLTQNKYTKFKTAPENKTRTAFDRATERVQKQSIDWSKTHYWDGGLND